MASDGLATILKTLDKSYPGRLFRGTEKPPTTFRPTGILPLDYACGGGFPVGGQVEIYGPESVGKTTLALQCMAASMKKNPTKFGAFIDVEHAFSPEWAEVQGVDLSRMVYSAPDSAEQAADIVGDLTKEPDIETVIFDSIGHLISYKELEKNAEDVIVGGVSKVVSRMAREVSGNIDPLLGTGQTVIWINQVRANFNAMSHSLNRPGGYVLGHADEMRIRLRRGNGRHVVTYQDFGEKEVGYVVTAIVEKNKCGAPRRSAWWWYNFETLGKYSFGIERFEANVRTLIYAGLIQRKGGYFSYEGPLGDFKVQGKDTLIQKLEKDPSLMEALCEEQLLRLAGKALVIDTSEEAQIGERGISIGDIVDED